MPKILLIGINARYTHSNPALYSIRSYCEGYGYDFEIVEFSINSKYDEILSYIKKSDATVFAFSVYIWNSSYIASILPLLKDIISDRQKIVLGGPEVAMNSDWWLENFHIHYIAMGGEESFLKLLKSDFKSTDSLQYGVNPDFSEVPFLYKEADWKNLDKKYIYYESSRGCPYRCSYCLSSRLDQSLQFRRTDQVIDELSIILSYKPRLVKFIDRTFNAKQIHHKPIWEYLIEHHGETRFHFEIHPGLLSDEDFDILAYVPQGIFQFELGVQSTNGRVLLEVNRKDNWDLIQKNILRLISLGNIHTHVDLICGLPYENMSGLKGSFDDIYNLGADDFQMGFLKILHGTEMADKSGEYGMIYSKNPPYEILGNRWLTRDNFILLHIMERFLNRLYNSNGFNFTLGLLFEGEFSSPFDIFMDLAIYAKEKNFDLYKKGWQDIGEFLSEYLLYKNFDEKYIDDILSYDWCINGKVHHYPKFLFSDKKLEVKKRGFRFFVEKSIGGTINFQDFTFTQSGLKRAIFLQPQSKVFKDKFLIKGNSLIFLPNGISFSFNL